MYLTLVSLFQSAAIVPPPPPPISPPSPPMAVTRSAPTRLQATQPKPYVIDVEASVDGKTLWQGSLRVGAQGGASFQRTLREAPPEGCAANEDYGFSGGVRDSLNIQITASRYDQASRQTYTVEWQRPTDQCPASVTRTAKISGSVQLEPGQSATLHGDAGLTLRLSRR